MDSKRLLQRNRNVQSVLETKQAAEAHRLFQDIKKNLASNSFGNAMNAAPMTSGMESKSGSKMRARNDMGMDQGGRQDEGGLEGLEEQPFEPAFMTNE